MTTEIKHRWNGSILFTSQAESLRSAVIEAVKSKTNLSNADLRGADLSNAYLRDADLSGANLSNTNLIGANLSNADLSGAIGYDANTSSVSVEKPPTTIIEKSQGSSSVIDWNKSVRTKGDKTPVRILCTDAQTFDGRNIVGIYGEMVESWHNSGAYNNEVVQSGMDLENVPEPGALPEAVYYSPSLKSFWASSKAYPDLIKYVPEAAK